MPQCMYSTCFYQFLFLCVAFPSQLCCDKIKYGDIVSIDITAEMIVGQIIIWINKSKITFKC